MDHIELMKQAAIQGVKTSPEREKELTGLRCLALELAVSTASIGERAQASCNSVIFDAEKYYEFLTNRP